MAKVKIYSSVFCSYCVHLKRELKKEGIKFEEINVSKNPDEFARVSKRTGSKSVPQVVVGRVAIAEYDSEEKLAKKIKKLLKK